MFVNIISSPKGGGAELLVRELHKIHQLRGIKSYAIFLTGNFFDLGKGEKTIGTNPKNPLNILYIRRQLKHLMKKEKKALTVHAHLTWPFFYVALATIGLKHVKLVYTEHNTTNKRRKIPFFWILERLIYRRYQKVICISEGVHRSLSEWVGPSLTKRLITIPNGSRIYDLVERPPLTNRKPKLVSIGSLTSKKNLVTAIRAIAILREQLDTYEIIGEGPERNQLEKTIEQEELENQVKLIGWSDQIEEHLKSADIQLIPSLWEGFGLVAVEGMSTGLSVVASDVAGLREVLAYGNPAITLVDDIENPDAWVRNIKISIKNLEKDTLGKLAQSAQSQAEKFTLDTMAERYIDVYHSL